LIIDSGRKPIFKKRMYLKRLRKTINSVIIYSKIINLV
jgi:hypothetical protein